MQRVNLLLPLFLALCFTSAITQELSLESKIQQADQLWKSNQLSQAIQHYQSIIEKDSIPKEYQSLIYLRLAQAQFAVKDFKNCRSTLSKIKTLAVLPPHHQLIMEELTKKLQGIPLIKHTPVPSNKKAVASFYIASTPNNIKENGPANNIFQSFEYALEAASKKLQNPNLPEGPIEIVFSEASYSQDRPIRLSAQNSGTKKNPVIIRAESGKKIKISGGQALRSWKREVNPDILALLPRESSSKVWVADLKESNVNGIDSLVFGGFSSQRSASGGPTFNTFPVPELFSDGIPQPMARWPNDRDTTVALKDFKSSRAFRWASEQDVWLHGYWFYLWADAYEKLSGISLKDSTVIIAPPVNNYGFAKSKWHVVNALSELDSPGEWCISIARGKIWYLPKNDIKPERIILSMRGTAIQAENCDYLTVNGLDLEYIRGDGMIFKNCSHLIVTNCSVKNTSGLGIKIAGGKAHLVHSCIIESMGRGGIDISAGDKLALVSSGSIIENCKISDLSRIDRTYTPAIVLEGDGIKVRHCFFGNIPSSGIRLEGNDMLVELNAFKKCVIESDDQGAIDVWGNPLYRGNIIRWNFFQDIGIPNLHMAAGVRLDDAISGFGIYENLFQRSSNNHFGGIQIHGGKDNFLEGNIFIDCHAAFSQSAWGDKRWQESINSKEHPMYKAMHTTNWQSDFWQRRYPALKQLLSDPDRNYTIDNVVINAESLFLRKSQRFQTLNNQLLKTADHLKSAVDFKPYLVPWHPVPVDEIGPY
ncbi:MAG: right-handed parallel beta-helix repeat-containing protein [Mariniphaga sp.]